MHFTSHFHVHSPPVQPEAPVSHTSIQSLLLKFSAQELIEVHSSSSSAPSSSTSTATPTTTTIVTSVDHPKLCAMRGVLAQRSGVKRKGDDAGIGGSSSSGAGGASSSLKHASGSAPSPLQAPVSSVTPAAGPPEWKAGARGGGPEKKSRTSKGQTSHLDMEIESLLNQQSTKEQQSKKVTWNMEHWNLEHIWRNIDWMHELH